MTCNALSLLLALLSLFLYVHFLFNEFFIRIPSDFCGSIFLTVIIPQISSLSQMHDLQSYLYRSYSSSLSVLVSIPYDEWLILVMLGGSGLLGN